MLEDIEEGELDYDDDGEVPDELEDLPDLPEYDPSTHKKENGDTASEEGEIVSDDDVRVDPSTLLECDCRNVSSLLHILLCIPFVERNEVMIF